MSDKAELLARTYRAMTDGDIETVLALIDPSITIWQTEELPWGGRYGGIEGFAEFFGKLRGTITSAVEVERIFEAGDHVVEVGRTRGTVNATGAEFDVAEVHIWELRGNKAVSFRAYIDTPAMLAALETD
ncbi:MAG: nuclear transport factor 2 family protein [Actinomycetota bacterium]